MCPPFEWSEWSPCSKACGHGHRYRKAIYQFVCPDHSEKCPDHRLEEEACDLPCLFDPSKYGGPGMCTYMACLCMSVCVFCACVYTVAVVAH